MSFYDHPLRVIGQLANESVGTLEDLQRLKAQVDSALSMVEQEQVVAMTDEEMREHANRFGPGAFVLGPFVVRRRNEPDVQNTFRFVNRG